MVDFTDILKAGQQLGDAKIIGDSQEYAVIPEGSTVEDLECFFPNPRRARAKVIVHTTETFGAYFNAFKETCSAIFADETAVTLVGIMDYHSRVDPAFREHRVTYTAPRSPEWLTWTKSNGRQMSQGAFAQFIEDNVIDIHEPTGADMLEVSRSIEAKKSVEFASSMRLQDGSQEFRYSETVEGSTKRGSLKIPDSFKLGIPVFVGDALYEMVARLRYRIDGGKLLLWYDLYRPEHILKDAFAQVVKAVADTVSTPVWMGQPGE